MVHIIQTFCMKAKTVCCQKAVVYFHMTNRGASLEEVRNHLSSPTAEEAEKNFVSY